MAKWKCNSCGTIREGRCKPREYEAQILKKWNRKKYLNIEEEYIW